MSSLFVIHVILLFSSIFVANVVRMKQQQDVSGWETVEKREREYLLRKELLARLVSIESLAALPKSEKRELVKKARQAGCGDGKVRLTTPKPLSSIDGEAEKTWGAGGVPFAWIVVWEAQPWARRFINNLLNGKPADLKEVAHLVHEVLFLPLAEPENKKSDRRSLRVVTLRRKGQTAGGLLIDTLVRSLKEIPFPYGRCPWCKSTVFIRYNGKGAPRKYCNDTCKNHSNEAARKGTKREYMREYMAKRRKKAKQATRKTR